MKPKHQRLVFVLFGVMFLCIATLLVMRAFKDNLVFFYSPSELAAKPLDPARLIRIGGLVESGSIERADDDRLVFRLSDGAQSVEVAYKGMVPALFREGQGAIAEGYAQDATHVTATRILTKHDEKYVPKEIVDSLKKTGHWHEQTP